MTSDTYYLFSDESGRFRKGNFYLRSAFIISVEDYQTLIQKFLELKDSFRIPRNHELKYNNIYQIKRYQEGKETKFQGIVESFKDIPYKSLLEFVKKSIGLLENFSIKIINIYTKFFNEPFKNQEDVEKDFMKCLMIRAEMDLEDAGAKGGAIFYDDTSIKNTLCGAYTEIFLEAKFIKDYKKIKDSLSFDISKFSAGIQIIDFIAGVIHSFLRGYSDGTNIFHEKISPFLRRCGNYGIGQTGFISFYMKKDPERNELVETIEKRIEEKK